MVATRSLFAALTFFRQARLDGGVRTGIMIHDTTVLSRFEEGDSEFDPILVWSVDLRCDGETLPSDPEGARAWLIDHEPIIRSGFTRFAEDLSVGTDLNFYPLQWSAFEGVSEGVRMRFVCNAQRRLDALGFAEVIEDIRDHWKERIEGLEAQVVTI